MFDSSEEVLDGFFLILVGKVCSCGVEFDINVEFKNGVLFWMFYVYIDVESINYVEDVNFVVVIEVGDLFINVFEN